MYNKIKDVLTGLALGCGLFAGQVLSASQNDGDYHRFWPDNLFAVEFVNETTGFVAGYSGTILRTKDAGQNWDALYVGRNELIRRLSFINGKEGWAIGHRGSIFHSKNSASTWKVQHQISGVYLRDVTFIDKNHGWVVGHDATILRTDDGGNSWHKQSLSGYIGRDVPRLHGVYAIDADNAIVVGEFGLVAHTQNAGELWTVTPAENTITWLAIDGSGDAIYVVGLDGSAAQLNVATDEQREIIDKRLAAKIARMEAKARRKAKRLKKQYVPVVAKSQIRSDIEYVVNAIDTKTSEHFFDVTVNTNGQAVAVGRSAVMQLNRQSAAPFLPQQSLPMNYLWFGGVDITSSGTVWAAGIRGLVISGALSDKSIHPALNLAASNNINLVSNRWGDGQ